MIQKEFAKQAGELAAADPSIIGLGVGGSWLNDELDEYSDLDLILVSDEKISGDKSQMLAYANKFGRLLNGFTGEHVGEPRLLICLYADPLLHVDIKFVTLEEFRSRVEDPFILADTNNALQTVIKDFPSHFPTPDLQWIEDRFWIWIHYALLKIGRGEYFEAYDFLSYLRLTVFGPLLHLQNGQQPRGVRKVEFKLPASDFTSLRSTIAAYTRESLLLSLENAVKLYRQLRASLFDKQTVIFQHATEEEVGRFFTTIRYQK